MNGNEPAFPTGGESLAYPGLTKREYTAIHIMAGMKSSTGMVNRCSDLAEELKMTQQEVMATIAVKDTDALLAELAKGEDK